MKRNLRREKEGADWDDRSRNEETLTVPLWIGRKVRSFMVLVFALGAGAGLGIGLSAGEPKPVKVEKGKESGGGQAGSQVQGRAVLSELDLDGSGKQSLICAEGPYVRYELTLEGGLNGKALQVNNNGWRGRSGWFSMAAASRDMEARRAP